MTGSRTVLVVDLGKLTAWHLIVPVLIVVAGVTLGTAAAGALSLGCAALLLLIGHMPTERYLNGTSSTPPFRWFSFQVLATAGVYLLAGFVPALVACIGLALFELWWRT